MRPEIDDLVARSFRVLCRRSPVKQGLSLLAAAIRPAFRADGIVEVTLGAPSFFAELDLRDRIQYLMYMRGHHELDTERLVARNLGSGSTFVDVGANIGYFSLLASAIDPHAAIYAFEPLPRNATRLRRNVALNPSSSIVVKEMALSDREGTADLVSADEAGESGWNHIGLASASDHASCRVRTTTLDAMVRDEGIPLPTFLKIDVEGHELAVLRGAAATLGAKGRRQVVIEINEPCLAAQGTSGDEINALLLGHGYRCFQIGRGGAIKPTAKPNPARRERNFYYVKES